MDIHLHGSVDVYHHLVAGSADQRLDQILAQLSALVAQVGPMTPVLQDIKDKVTALGTAVAANTQIGTSVVTLLQGLTAMIAALRQQLADAIAANDPAAIQAVLDGLTALETSVVTDTQTLTDAAIANTPAAP